MAGKGTKGATPSASVRGPDCPIPVTRSSSKRLLLCCLHDLWRLASTFARRVRPSSARQRRARYTREGGRGPGAVRMPVVSRMEVSRLRKRSLQLESWGCLPRWTSCTGLRALRGIVIVPNQPHTDEAAPTFVQTVPSTKSVGEVAPGLLGTLRCSKFTHPAQHPAVERTEPDGDISLIPRGR